MTASERKAWRFFLENAGYCTPPGRVACARDLMRAEKWAEQNDVTVEWVSDDIPYELGDAESRYPDEVLGCVLSLDGVCVSLWGIGGPDDNYRRIVEAELASELQQVVFEKIAMDVPQM